MWCYGGVQMLMWTNVNVLATRVLIYDNRLILYMEMEEGKLVEEIDMLRYKDVNDDIDGRESESDIFSWNADFSSAFTISRFKLQCSRFNQSVNYNLSWKP